MARSFPPEGLTLTNQTMDKHRPIELRRRISPLDQFLIQSHIVRRFRVLPSVSFGTGDAPIVMSYPRNAGHYGTHKPTRLDNS